LIYLGGAQSRALTKGMISVIIESMNTEVTLQARAAMYAALGDPARLAVVDALALGDVSPSELGQSLHLSSNLLAHHLRVLEKAGIVRRSRSEADRRRTYVQLVPAALPIPPMAGIVPAPRVVFVCTRNSARSQLAAALWAGRSRVPAASAGTHPGPRVHRRAISTARRRGLAFHPGGTAHVREVIRPDDLVVAVCDKAYEELSQQRRCLHWSVPDPVRAGTDEAFEAAFEEIKARVGRLAAAVAPDSS
jgi:protein-tyrosine-phosphatase/DNA-binding MarR family transcriptional regulator